MRRTSRLFELKSSSELRRKSRLRIPIRTVFRLVKLIVAIANVLATVPTKALAQPTITVQPTDQTASLFADAAFRVAAAGDAPLSYQWQFNRTNLANMTQMALSVTNIQRANAGDYDVIVANSSGSVTSRVARLTITQFNSLYEFGYSWTDTQGLGCGWAAPDYYMHSACNGPMWPEFLSTNLNLSYVAVNNYAHCGAGALDVFNQASQVSLPSKPELSLYCLMFCDDVLRGLPPGSPGTDYLSVTNESPWAQVIQTGVVENSNAVTRLYAKGARTIVAQSEIDLSGAPGALSAFANDLSGLSKFGEYCARYNTGFSNAVIAFGQSKPDLRIIWVDLFSKLENVIANPAQYGFTKTAVDALDDTALGDKSFTGPGADYVFWNRFHPTSKLQELIAKWSLEALRNTILETLEGTKFEGSFAIRMNHLQIGSDYTLQSSSDLRNWKSVFDFTAAAGTNEWTTSTAEVRPLFYRLARQP
jgi:phospholipase/lecithinase/hemolysin